MTQGQFTQNALRLEQQRLSQLLHYLPTLRLKKALLQDSVAKARQEEENAAYALSNQQESILSLAPLLLNQGNLDIGQLAQVEQWNKRFENVAGLELPQYIDTKFTPFSYNLLDTPPWLETAIKELRLWQSLRGKTHILRERKRLLEKELREVSIRVNLFEKRLIPQAKEQIRKIKVFLGDLFLASVAQAKIAKKKIELRKKVLV